MATIIPFRGVSYDQTKVSDISRVVAPPYDIIDRNRQRALHDRHPYNVIRLELGLDQPGDNQTENKYTRAAQHLQGWRRGGVLGQDPVPAIYLYTVEYQTAVTGTTVSRTLRGFLTTVKLEEFGSGAIFPHEDTRSAAKTDRFRLLETCRANFSPIFALFSDPDSATLQLIEKSVDVARPRVEFCDDDGFRQRLWAITDTAVLHEVTQAVRPKPLFIADGHHRYETALAYRRMRRQQDLPPSTAQAYDNVLMLISGLEDPGLTVLPTHRVLHLSLPSVEEIKRRLDNTFLIEDIPFSGRPNTAGRAALLRQLRERGGSEQVFGLASSGASSYLLLTLKTQYRNRPGISARDRLDVSVLHRYLVEPLCPSLDEQSILYTKDEQDALDQVEHGQAQAALLLNPTKVSEVQAVAAAGDRMPHKSTYFFPKPLTGLVMNVFEEPPVPLTPYPSRPRQT
jgi:uncharacterized protein (DUF1015 family)